MICNRILAFVLVVQQAFAYIDKNVMECMQDNGVTEFARLLSGVDLTGDGPFTVLAPTNAAFHSLDPDIFTALTREASLVSQVANYHIINEFAVLPELVRAGEVYSMEGQPLEFTGSSSAILINKEARPIAGNKSDIICNNGIVHIIDKMLIPPLFSTNNIPTVLLIRDDIFRDFTMALVLNNLTTILEGNEFTLFAPTDLGMARYNEMMSIPPGTSGAMAIFYEVMKYHVVPGRRTSHDLRDGQKLYTYHGSPVEVTITSKGMSVDHAKIVETDIPASNGVIHAIDHMLFPTDLLDNLVSIASG